MDKKWRLQTQMTVEARQRALISKEDRVKDSQRALFFLLIFYKGIFTEKKFLYHKKKNNATEILSGSWHWFSVLGKL